MKLSVSLPPDDVAFLDGYVKTRAYRSRSAVVHHAIDALRAEELRAAYADAWEEWSHSGEASLWATTAGDGV